MGEWASHLLQISNIEIEKNHHCRQVARRSFKFEIAAIPGFDLIISVIQVMAMVTNFYFQAIPPPSTRLLARISPNWWGRAVKQLLAELNHQQ